MSLNIENREIENVHVIDDNSEARLSYQDFLIALDLNPVLENGPFAQPTDVVHNIKNGSSGVLCDYMLNQTDYADFKGAETVKCMYQKRIPAILVTKYGKAEIEEIREYRQWIPSLLIPDHLDEESLIEGFQSCIREFNDIISDNRKPWRTQVRVDFLEKERSVLYLIVPGWNSNQIIKLRFAAVPDAILEKILKNEKRFYVKTNLGADTEDELYFTDWEI